jgi:uncharacterized membrane protein (UPF0127 family)
MCSFAALLLAVTATLPPPNPPLPVTYVEAPHARLALETASTPQEQERGLMSRPALAPRTGMLFVFSQDAPVSFWMKDTLIPLDMIFVAADGKVREVFAHVAVVPAEMPDSEIPFETARARYVIELAAGEAARDGIVPGTTLRFLTAPAR